MPPPCLQDTTRLQNSYSLHNQRGQHCVHCARGITKAPVHQTNWIGDHYHPEGAARCAPIVPLPPIRNSRPLQNEGAVIANALRSQPQARAVTPHFYPVLLHFYPTFPPFLPRSASSFYPVFTPLLPHCQFLPSQAFYPSFTPFLVLCACRFPLFYPRGKTAHFLLVSVNATKW